MKPHRFMFRFWLDVNKSDERDLAEWLESLKAKRQFTRTIRDALNLYRSLKEGRLDLLRSMFPGFELTPAQEWQAMMEELQAIRQAQESAATMPPAQQPSTRPMFDDEPAPAPVMVSSNMSELSGGSRQLAERDSSGDDDLQDLIDVKEVKSEGGKATENFIKSMIGMQNAKSTKDPDARPVRQLKRATDLSELIEIKPAKTT